MLIKNTAKELETWAGRSAFSYVGNVAIGTRISFGKSAVVEITKEQFDQLLLAFRGKKFILGHQEMRLQKGVLVIGYKKMYLGLRLLHMLEQYLFMRGMLKKMG